MNQRAHYSIDQFASSSRGACSTIGTGDLLRVAAGRLWTHGAGGLLRRCIDCCNGHRVDEPDEFVDQNVEVNGVVHWLRNYGAGLRTVVEAFPNFHWDLQHLLINDCWLLGERSGCA